MFRVAVESILGLSVRGGAQLVLNPCISNAWPRATLRYREPTAGGVYEIVIENPAGRETGVRTAFLDGQPATIENGAAIVPLIADSQTYRVLLEL
jgi:cellobiose phosphorylase